MTGNMAAAICFGIVAVSGSSLASAQEPRARVAAAAAAARAVRAGYPAGPSAIVYRRDSTLAANVAREARVATASVREGVDCVNTSSSSSCLLNRVVVTLEVFEAKVDKDWATVVVIARSKSEVPKSLHFGAFRIRLRSVGGMWIVQEIIPAAIS